MCSPISVASNELARSDLEASQTVALTGTLDDLTCPELLQILNLGRKSGTLLVRSGRREATVHIRNGEVVDAVMGELKAADAVYRVLALASGEFEFSRCTDAMPRTITSSTESLVLEAARRWDEWSQFEDQIGEMNQVLRVCAGATEIIPTLDSIPKAILDLVDARRDIATIVRESGIEPEEALRVVRTLIADHVVEAWSDAQVSWAGQQVHVDPNAECSGLKIVVGVNNADRQLSAEHDPRSPQDPEGQTAEALLAG
ncbi:hypothetical protein AMK68_00485 [candidate division KD3-62 bacterium DG_56]|uniref:PatA-like N-terminal domain-containing protein n=1 Tax=candidate division KD3-62 bacterium DG_56 TaxID=1704032 RepID=A0A0S7XQQ5_9BACT|nr:MAG: hypothetical protein AMK68_00485 [candidate division KD3-62 bacterium DG_56]